MNTYAKAQLILLNKYDVLVDVSELSDESLKNIIDLGENGLPDENGNMTFARWRNAIGGVGADFKLAQYTYPSGNCKMAGLKVSVDLAAAIKSAEKVGKIKLRATVSEHKSALESQKNAHEDSIDQITDTYEKKLSELRREMSERERKYKDKLEQLNAELEQKNSEVEKEAYDRGVKESLKRYRGELQNQLIIVRDIANEENQKRWIPGIVMDLNECIDKFDKTGDVFPISVHAIVAELMDRATKRVQALQAHIAARANNKM